MEYDMQEFSLDLWRNLNGTGGNMVVSPVSILTAFGMLLLGARNNSEIQLKTALHMDISIGDPKFLSFFHTVVNALNMNVSEKVMKNGYVNMANKLFSGTNFGIENEYVEKLKNNFRSDLQKVNFVDNEAAAGIINSWVNNVTNSKIPKLMDADSLDGETALVLANAIYFQGRWKHVFKSKDTKPDTFTKLDGCGKKISMMRQEQFFRSIETIDELNATAVELPLFQKRFSFVILLPLQSSSLRAMESALNESNIRNVMQDMKNHRVVLSMPKFKVESTIQLKDIMTQLGAVDIFQSDNADLSGIGPNLFVSQAVHKAYLKVDESGVEAAAATGIGVSFRSMPPPVEFEIKVNRPFLCWLWDSQLKSILFLARVTSPE